MKKTDTQPVTNYRDQLKQRAQGWYADRNFDGTDGTTDTDALGAALIEKLDELEGNAKTYKENNDRLVGLFNSDPRSAEFLNQWVSKGDPLAALVETFGDDFAEAMQSPEAREKFVESHNKWLERKAADDAANDQREQNWQKSLEDLEAFGNSKGFNDDQKVQLVVRLHQVGVNAIEGIYTTEDFQMAYDASNYAKDVQEARHEGEVAGRNAKIQERMREKRQPETMPPALAGQGAPATEPRERRRTDADKVREMFGLGK